MHAVCQQNREISITKFCQHLQTRSTGNARRFSCFFCCLSADNRNRTKRPLSSGNCLQYVLHKSSWNKMRFPHCSPETFCRLFPVGLPPRKNRNTVHMPVPVPPMHNPSWFSCCLFLSIFSRSNAVPPTPLHACNSQASDNNNLVSKIMYGLLADRRTVLAVLLCSTVAVAIPPHRPSPKSFQTAGRLPSWKLANPYRVAMAAFVVTSSPA